MNRDSPERLAEVSRFLKLKISKEQELQGIVELAAEICGTPMAIITLMDGETQFIKFSNGVEIDQVKYTDTFCQHTLEQDKLLVIPDTTKDARVSGNMFVKESPKVRFYAGLPLTSHNGNAIGTLCVFDMDARDLSQSQQLMLRSLSEQITWLLEFDMTHQVLTEQYEEAVASTTTLLTYFQSSSSCHLLMDENMLAIAYNQALADLMFMNHRANFEEGMKVTDFVHPSFRSEFIDYFTRALRGEIIAVERHLEYASGKICWYITYEPAYNTEGTTIGVSLNATDISQSVSNKEQIEAQVVAINKINDIQANQLMEPIDKINCKTEQISRLPGVGSIVEFDLLKMAVAELLEKKERIKDIISTET